MIQSLGFVYDEIPSKDMGVFQVSLSGGLYDEQFMASKTIHEERIRGRDTSYLLGVDYEPLSFSLTLAFEDGMTDEQIYKIARWLKQDYYKPFYTLDNPERIFYCMVADDIRIVHNGIKQGYITLTMQCNSPYTYSPYYEGIFDLTNNTEEGTQIEIENKGEEMQPELWIKTHESGDFSIVNTTNGGDELWLSSLQENETIYIDCESEDIDSDLPLAYRYDNHNGVFLNLPYGVNRLMVYGKVYLKIKYRYKFLLGF